MLHLSIRPSENVIVRNHWQNKSWGTEERNGDFPILTNETFEIIILAEEIQYKIAVNGKHFCLFDHRLPLHQGHFISISEGCSIESVLIERNVEQKGVDIPLGHYPSEHPPPYSLQDTELPRYDAAGNQLNTKFSKIISYLCKCFPVKK